MTLRVELYGCEIKLKGKLSAFCKYPLLLDDYDWLRAVQLKCNTDAKSVTQVHRCKLHIVILDYDLLKDNKFYMPIISSKTMTKNFVHFSNAKKWLQKRYSSKNFHVYIINQ